MRRIHCIQGSKEWIAARLGVPTASEIGRILTPKTWQYGKGAKAYIHELIAELFLTEIPSPNDYKPISRAMKEGIRREPEARAFYEFSQNVDCEQVGFITTDDGRFGCSPDSLVGEDGGLEIKDPIQTTQVAWLEGRGVPAEHLAQVHDSLLVTGRAWWDFLSYCPPLPALLVRVEPNDLTNKLRIAKELFWVDFQETLQRIRGIGNVLRCQPEKKQSLFEIMAEIAGGVELLKYDDLVTKLLENNDA